MELPAILDQLSFTTYEKSVMSFLAGVDASSATEIVKKAKVPQGRVYAVLASLKGSGIVDEIPSSPKMFQIADIQQKLREYLEGEKTSISALQTAVKDMQSKPKEYHHLKTPTSVILFTGRTEHLQAITSMREAAKTELLQIAPLFQGSFSSNLSLQKALERGVSSKVIVGKVTSSNAKAAALALSAGSDVRSSTRSDLLSLLIKDRSQFLLGVQDYRKEEERLTLLGGNRAIMQALVKEFFEEWAHARPVSTISLGKIVKKG